MLTDRKPLMKSLRRSHTSSSSPTNSSSPLSSSPWIHLRSALLVAAFISSSSSIVSIHRSGHKSPWSLRRRKHALLPKQWKSFFTHDGKFSDGGLKFLKKARSGGIDPSIRAEVWPFLLGVYDVNSSKEERDLARGQMRKEYENLRKQCRRILKCTDKSCKLKETSGTNSNENNDDFSELIDFSGLDEIVNSTRSSFSEECNIVSEHSNNSDINFQRSGLVLEEDVDNNVLTWEDGLFGDLFTSDSESSEELDIVEPFIRTEVIEENDINMPALESSNSITESDSHSHIEEDFATFQRIMRLDAVRADADWIMYSPSQAAISELKARRLAESVGLKDYDHLEPCRIYHAARLVAILEAYALYDPETGYCQGMSDLLSPIIAVMEDDCDAFWCFTNFMKKTRYNFRLDEVGIRRQLNIVSKIIKCKDIHLYRHLEKLEAEDCFFVYRMVVVLFRRELNLEQTLCLWEAMWADQAAILAGITKSSWGRMRLRAPPTDDLLLYAIAACVLQRRKLIVEKYSSVDEIMRDCNSMAGQLDVWKLLDDAHDLVVNLHDKI
ncbi:rab GTPase-activating protein 22-like [Euphorbia lathyris]|uniref:rab GTPase-activating protein 22-like n=1 Tax=Euphorbia lathyris TaxID=212925 RepID=UPI00331357E2